MIFLSTGWADELNEVSCILRYTMVEHQEGSALQCGWQIEKLCCPRPKSLVYVFPGTASIGSLLEILDITFVLLYIHCPHSRWGKGSLHSCWCLYFVSFRATATPEAALGETLHKHPMNALFRWEDKSRSRSGQGMECNESSLNFSTVFTQGLLPPEGPGENMLFPTLMPSVILLRFLWEPGVSRKSPRFATLLFIRHVADCIGLKKNLCNASVLSYYFTLLHNSFVFSHALAQAQARKLSQSRDKPELESKVKRNCSGELSAQC